LPARPDQLRLFIPRFLRFINPHKFQTVPSGRWS